MGSKRDSVKAPQVSEPLTGCFVHLATAIVLAAFCTYMIILNFPQLREFCAGQCVFGCSIAAVPVDPAATLAEYKANYDFSDIIPNPAALLEEYKRNFDFSDIIPTNCRRKTKRVDPSALLEEYKRNHDFSDIIPQNSKSDEL